MSVSPFKLQDKRIKKILVPVKIHTTYKIIYINLEPEDTITKLKQTVSDKMGFLKAMKFSIFNGHQQLPETQTLSQCNIQKGTVLRTKLDKNPNRMSVLRGSMVSSVYSSRHNLNDSS